MNWLLLITFKRDTFKKELAILQAEFQGPVESPEIARLENKMISHQFKGMAIITQAWEEDQIQGFICKTVWVVPMP